MPENNTPPNTTSTLTFIGTRLNEAELKGFLKLQKDMDIEGFGAQAKTLRELVRDRLKQSGYLGKPKQ